MIKDKILASTFANTTLILSAFFFIADFFTSLDLSRVFAVLKKSLQVMLQFVEESTQPLDASKTLNSAYQKLVQVSGALYCMSDLIQIPMDLWQFSIFLVSIPWLSRGDSSWNDLPHKFGLSVDVLARFGPRLGPLITRENMDMCLHLLAVFPSDAAPTWRTQVFLLVLVIHIRTNTFNTRQSKKVLDSGFHDVYPGFQAQDSTFLVSYCNN